MGHSSNRIWIHVLWFTKNKEPLIHAAFEQDLYAQIKAEFKKFDCNAIAVNGMPNHIHILFWLHPSISVATIIKQVKGTSSFWVNEGKRSNSKFSWQRGYYAYSIQYNDYERVVDYINNQKIHHAKKGLDDVLEEGE